MLRRPSWPRDTEPAVHAADALEVALRRELVFDAAPRRHACGGDVGVGQLRDAAQRCGQVAHGARLEAPARLAFDDELRQAAALVADEARLQGTGAARTPLEDETNEALVETIWKMASGGTPARQCESEVPVDAYRVRRLLAHWVEEGALAVAG